MGSDLHSSARRYKVAVVVQEHAGHAKPGILFTRLCEKLDQLFLGELPDCRTDVAEVNHSNCTDRDIRQLDESTARCLFGSALPRITPHQVELLERTTQVLAENPHLTDGIRQLAAEEAEAMARYSSIAARKEMPTPTGGERLMLMVRRVVESRR